VGMLGCDCLTFSLLRLQKLKYGNSFLALSPSLFPLRFLADLTMVCCCLDLILCTTVLCITVNSAILDVCLSIFNPTYSRSLATSK